MCKKYFNKAKNWVYLIQLDVIMFCPQVCRSSQEVPNLPCRWADGMALIALVSTLALAVLFTTPTALAFLTKALSPYSVPLIATFVASLAASFYLCNTQPHYNVDLWGTETEDGSRLYTSKNEMFNQFRLNIAEETLNFDSYEPYAKMVRKLIYNVPFLIFTYGEMKALNPRLKSENYIYLSKPFETVLSTRFKQSNEPKQADLVVYYDEQKKMVHLGVYLGNHKVRSMWEDVKTHDSYVVDHDLFFTGYTDGNTAKFYTPLLK